MRRIFARLESAVKPDAPEFVLIGGQAVALWTARLLDPEKDEVASRVTTSKDIDFLGGTQIVKHCAVLLGGRAQIASLDQPGTPSSGVIVFEDSEGNERQLDFLDMPAGLDMNDVLETAQLLEIPEGPEGDPPFHLWVIHPERLLESRVANLGLPGKQSALSLDQLRASMRCAREFALEILSSGQLTQRESVRATLDYNERIFQLARYRGARAFGLGIDVFEAVVLDERLPGKFFERRLPQMRAKLERHRRPPA